MKKFFIIALLMATVFANTITIDISENQFTQTIEFDAPTVIDQSIQDVIFSIKLNIETNGNFVLKIGGEEEYLTEFEEIVKSKEFVQALVNPFGITKVNTITKGEVSGTVLDIQGNGIIGKEDWMNEKTMSIDAKSSETTGSVIIKGTLGDLPGEIEIYKPFDQDYSLTVYGAWLTDPEPDNAGGRAYFWNSAPNTLKIKELEPTSGFEFDIMWLGIILVVIAVAGYLVYQNKDKLIPKKGKKKKK